MPTLPEPKGPYSVGATTFFLPIRPSFPVGASRVRKPTSSAAHPHTHKGGEGADEELEHTLVFEEVAFTAFYPADLEKHAKETHHHHGGSWLSWKNKGDGKGVDWVCRPVEETLKGYEHFGGQSYPAWVAALIRPIISHLGSSIKIPAYENTPLLSPPPNGAPWPLVIFSHGLAGARTSYSHLCTRIAAQGRVVLALEHRDGTGPAVFPRGPDGAPKTLYYVNPEDAIWPEDAPALEPTIGSLGKGKHSDGVALRLRKDQLEFRRREVYAAVEAMRAVCGGKAKGLLETMDGKKIDWDSWAGKVDFGSVDLVAHSFGGATLFSILSTPPPPMPSSDATYAPLHVRRALALDPWLEPLPSAGPKPLPSSSPPELLVLNSEGFTLWDAHFDSLQAAARAFSPARVLTLVKAQHVSFSDFPLVTPRRLQGGVDGEAMLEKIGVLAEAFLRGELDLRAEQLGVEGVHTRKMELETDEKGKRSLVGEQGDVVMH